MPRWKSPTMTQWEAAEILQRAYDDGYARGLAGETPRPANPFDRWSAWDRLKDDQRVRGRADGYAEFVRRVHQAMATWPPPEAPDVADGGA